MTADKVGPLLLVVVLITYFLIYRFISTGLVDSLILTLNLGTLTLLVPMLVSSGRVPVAVVASLLLLVLTSPVIGQLWFQQRARQNQKTQTQNVLFRRSKGDADLRYDLAEKFANLAELMIDPDCDPSLHSGFTWRARHRQRQTFLAALGVTQLFEPINEEELYQPDALMWGRWFRSTVGVPSVLLFLAACLVFLQQ